MRLTRDEADRSGRCCVDHGGLQAPALAAELASTIREAFPRPAGRVTEGSASVHIGQHADRRPSEGLILDDATERGQQ